MLHGDLPGKKSQDNFFLAYNSIAFVLSLFFPEKSSKPGLIDAGNGTIKLDINNTILYHNIYHRSSKYVGLGLQSLVQSLITAFTQ
jgi:hypothetical protein